MVRPSAFAVFRLMTRSNLVGCSTGRSAAVGLDRTPLRMAHRYLPRTGPTRGVYCVGLPLGLVGDASGVGPSGIWLRSPLSPSALTGDDQSHDEPPAEGTRSHLASVFFRRSTGAATRIRRTP